MTINPNFHEDGLTYDKVLDRFIYKLISKDDRCLIEQYVIEGMDNNKICAITARRIAQSLCGWRRFLNVEYRCITIDEIRVAIRRMKAANKYSPNTQHLLIHELKAFTKWLRRKKIIVIDSDELNEIKLPPKHMMSIKSTDILDDAAINKLIDAAQTPRDKAWIALLAENGVRVQEAGSLTWEDVDITKDRVRITVTDAKDPSKTRKAYVVVRASYIRELRKSQSGDKGSDYVFRKFIKGNRIGKEPVKYGTMKRVLKSIAKDASVVFPKGANARLFRASAVTNMLRAGVSETAIKKTTWSSGLNSRMFMHYEKLSDIDTERMIMSASSSVELPEPVHNKDNTAIICTCGAKNAPGSIFCIDCHNPLTKKASNKLQTAQDAIAEYAEDPEFAIGFAEYMKERAKKHGKRS